jgi:hypothetical protein
VARRSSTQTAKPRLAPKRKAAKTLTATAAPSTAGGKHTANTTQDKLLPYDLFKACISRARNLLRIHEAAHGRRAKPDPYLADAHRAAIVLAVAALDAFVRAYVIGRVRHVLVSSNSLTEALAVQVKRFLKEDGLLDAARRSDLLERVEKAFSADFEKKSFQGVRVISEYMAMVGHSNVFHDISVSANLNEDTLCGQLNKYTDRRHVIAHRGDFDLTRNPPVENRITKTDAEECIRLVSCIAEHIHGLGTD